MKYELTLKTAQSGDIAIYTTYVAIATYTTYAAELPSETTPEQLLNGVKEMMTRANLFDIELSKNIKLTSVEVKWK